MKQKILLVGDHPYCTTGNGNMMQELLSRIDYNKYEVACYAAHEVDPALFAAFGDYPYKIIPSRQGNDAYGLQNLLRLLFTQKVDLFVTVGIDVWRYIPVLPDLLKIRAMRGFKWASIMPYDSPYIRQEWISLMMNIDYPTVYSEFGFNLLKSYLPNVSYFRPPLANSEIYRIMSKEEKYPYKQKYFPSAGLDSYIFGFVGINQYRKEPHKLLEAFLRLKRKTDKKIHLYLHTELEGGVYNIKQIAQDMGAETGDVIIKTPKVRYPETEMVGIYNCIDCFVLPSMQEGLSWTILNAMLCGCSIVATETTAHIELLKNVYPMVPCNIDTVLPVDTANGPSQIKAKGCTVEDLIFKMEKMLYSSPTKITNLREKGKKKALKWISHESDINGFIEKALVVKVVKPKATSLNVKKITDRFLFAQHSSAGDVLMTTRCFKGLKERHPDLKMDYMTMPQFMNIVEDNPYIDKVIPWTDEALKDYQIVYNPHGDRIAPGHWGRNANSLLADFYWKILMVEPDNFFINKRNPTINQNIFTDWKVEDGSKKWLIDSKLICIVHTTGGDLQFRTYQYMADVCEGLKDKYFTVQVGGKTDYPAGADLDLRGKLTFQETAWVMSKAKLAITVDSFVSHLAGALGVSQVALYGSGNASVVKPLQCGGKLITLSPDYIRDCIGLGPCSASVRDCPMPCTGSHDPKTILEAVENIEMQQMYEKRKRTKREAKLSINHENEEVDHEQACCS